MDSDVLTKSLLAAVVAGIVASALCTVWTATTLVGNTATVSSSELPVYLLGTFVVTSVFTLILSVALGWSTFLIASRFGTPRWWWAVGAGLAIAVVAEVVVSGLLSFAVFPIAAASGGAFWLTLRALGFEHHG